MVDAEKLGGCVRYSKRRQTALPPHVDRSRLVRTVVARRHVRLVILDLMALYGARAICVVASNRGQREAKEHRDRDTQGDLRRNRIEDARLGSRDRADDDDCSEQSGGCERPRTRAMAPCVKAELPDTAAPP
jgi:hypothetical protein